VFGKYRLKPALRLADLTEVQVVLGGFTKKLDKSENKLHFVCPTVWIHETTFLSIPLLVKSRKITYIYMKNYGNLYEHVKSVATDTDCKCVARDRDCKCVARDRDLNPLLQTQTANPLLQTQT
jgi:hypothetical protein